MGQLDSGSGSGLVLDLRTVGMNSLQIFMKEQIATINTRFVYAMRSIGKGAEAGRMFCGVMNLPQPPTRFAPLRLYYGSAIRRNHSSVQNMRQAIWAIFLHKLSTDEYPQHGFCPIGEDSWCGFKKAEASSKSYKHKTSLPVAVVEAMRPIFRDLSHPDLLKKCLHEKHKPE
ncbi:uncharacterized protein TNCV_48271 [Trichonephila clavipes]|nr:uncharacterized protein TNCV_48271 [Trichonephila clavipes]